MPDSPLQQYINDQLSQGFTLEQLKPVLQQSGYTEDQINQAFSIVQHPTSPPFLSPVPPSVSPAVNAAPELSKTQTVPLSHPSSGKKALPLVLALVLLIALGGGGAWAYFNLWLNPERILLQTWNNHLKVKAVSYQGELVANITIKNPQQISQIFTDTETKVLGMSTSRLAMGEFFMPNYEITQEGSASPENITLGIQFQGKTDHTSSDWQNRQSELTLEIVKQGLDQLIDFDNNLGIDIKSMGTTFYIRLRQIPDFGLLNFQTIDNQWIKLDLQSLIDQYAVQQVEINTELETLSQKTEQHNQQFTELLKKYPVIRVTDQLPGQQLDQVDTYHYRFVIDEINLAKFLSEANKIYLQESEQALSNTISQEDIDKLSQQLIELDLPPGEIWIGKPDKLIRKIKFVIDLAQLSPETSDQYTGELTFEINYSNYNQPQDITLPDQFITTDDLIQKFTNGDFTNQSALMKIQGELMQQEPVNRDNLRRSDIFAITNAVYQYAVENKGEVPPGITSQLQDVGTSGVNLGQYIVPTYIFEIPFDPLNGSPETTGYLISQDPTGRILITASGEVIPVIQVTR